MQTNVSELLRDFSKIRRAALSGERVIVKTREGNLIIEAEKSSACNLIGSMKEVILWSADDLDAPTLPDSEWNASL